MALLRLPDAGFPLTPGASGDGNVPQEPSTQQQTLAGFGTVIPIIYGEARVGGLIANAATFSNSLILTVVWCVGEISAMDIFINDEAPPAGVSITSYYGSPHQTPDPYLETVFPGYSDSLVYVDPLFGRLGIAYSVVVIPAGTAGINGVPRITARIYGRLVYSVLNSSRRYSTNPADILADFVSDPIVGMRRSVNRKSHAQLAQYCNDTMRLGGKRRELHLVLDSAQDVTQWVETIRTYAGCLLYFDGNEAFFVPYRSTSALTLEGSYAIGPEHIIKDSLQVSRNPAHPNVVRVNYTDVTIVPWVTYNAYAATDAVIAGTTAWREESLSMAGIHNFGQAYREAAERLAYYEHGDPHISFVLTDIGLKYAVGDVIYLTHPLGFSNEPFLLETISGSGPGRWAVTACHYHEGLFCDEDPDPPGSLVVGPEDPPYGPVTGLTLTEVISKAGKMPISKIQASWTGLGGINLDKYEIQWQGRNSSAWNTDFSPTENWTSPQVAVGVLYTVRVRQVFTDGSVGTWLTGELAIVGKTTTGWEPPTPPTGISGAFFLELKWTLPGGDDVSHTEVYMSTVDNIATAKLVAEVAAPYDRYMVPGLPAGVCRYFWVRFVDTSGNRTDFSPDTPAGIRLCTPSADADLMTYLTGQIKESHLYDTLAAKIDDSSNSSKQVSVQVAQLEQDVYGEYFVKIDANGRVAGFGLANQVDGYSQFLVVADRFAIVSPDNSLELAPFIVDGGTVYLNKTSIKHADIEAAHIADLTLTTGKIAENQITTIGGMYDYTTRTYHDSGQSIQDGTFPVTRIIGSFDVVGDNVYCIAIFSQFVLDADVDCHTTITIKLSGGYTDEYSISCSDKGVQQLIWYPVIDPQESRAPITVTLWITVTPTIYSELTKVYDADGDRIEYVKHLSSAYTLEHGMAAVTYAR